MKRLINSTMILSMALYIVPPFAAQAQDLKVTIDGQDVICLPNKKTPCPDGALCVEVKNPKNCEARAAEAIAAAAAGVTVAPEVAPIRLPPMPPQHRPLPMRLLLLPQHRLPLMQPLPPMPPQHRLLPMLRLRLMLLPSRPPPMRLLPPLRTRLRPRPLQMPPLPTRLLRIRLQRRLLPTRLLRLRPLPIKPPRIRLLPMPPLRTRLPPTRLRHKLPLIRLLPTKPLRTKLLPTRLLRMPPPPTKPPLKSRFPRKSHPMPLRRMQR